MKNGFVKSHGLGNDYIVLNEAELSFVVEEAAIRKICDPHFGIGSDGIVLKVASDKADFGLRIFNPDGSEAEKSGNGLRIFSKYLYDYGFAATADFSVETKGGVVRAYILGMVAKKARVVKVDMGQAVFASALIPTTINKAEVLDEPLVIGDFAASMSCVSVGNPHCVILQAELEEDLIKQYGSAIEHHAYFPNRINVQFVKVVSRQQAEVLIWERGAGYTLASGSSSCAVAAVLRKKGLVDDTVTIVMPGGSLQVEIDADWNIRMTGEVREIASGVLSPELLADIQLG